MQTPNLSDNQVEYRSVRVAGAWLPDGLAIDAYWSGLRWNGFVTPLFTLAGARMLCEHMASLQYVDSDGSFLLTDEHGTTPISPNPHIVGGEALQLYGIGDSWCWSLVEDADAGARPDAGARLRLRVRPAVYAWLDQLAQADGLGLAAYAETLIAGYIEQRMECRSRMDLSGLEVPLALARNSVRIADGKEIVIGAAEWLKLVDAAVLIDEDESPFHRLPLPQRREAFAEAVLEQLGRELGRV